MEPITVGVAGIVLLLVMLALGVHIALALMSVGLIGNMLLLGFNPSGWLAIGQAYYAVATSVLITIPLFVFMGVLAGISGLSRDIYKVIGMWVGRFRGALGVATVFSCTAFGVVTGSSMVTAAVFAQVSAPEMRRYGYDKRLAYGICSSAGAIGMLIPPSILIIIYSLLAELSVGKMLIAAIGPGLLLAVLFSLGILIIGWLKPDMVGGKSAPVAAEASWRERFSGLVLLWPVYVCAVIIIGGIYGGVFSPTEAAAWGALVLIIITIATGGRERWRILARCGLQTVATSAMIFFILAGAAIFARFLMLSQITPTVMTWVFGLGLSKLQFILIMALLYLIMGCFLDSISMLSITLPILTPVVKAMGIDPIYFGVIMIMAIEAGLVTPPVGLNVYATKGVAEPDVTLEDIFIGSAPFFILFLIAIPLLIAFPSLITYLPARLF